MYPQDVPETVRVQVFLDMLVGTFDAAWGNPNRLEGAVASLVQSTGSHGRYPNVLSKQQHLLSYLKAVLAPLDESSHASQPPLNLSEAKHVVEDRPGGHLASTALAPSDPATDTRDQDWPQVSQQPHRHPV
jgi:hypothetical protein